MQGTLCLLIKDNKILLALKKRGFGAGKWNGPGGKVEKGEEIIDAAIRETKEEIGVEIINPEKIGIMRFHFPYKQDWDMEVHVFLVKEWRGSPEESEEMAPEWFSLDEIPYEKMWADDKFWLPRILKGEKVEADFVFKEGETIDKHAIKVVRSFNFKN